MRKPAARWFPFFGAGCASDAARVAERPGGRTLVPARGGGPRWVIGDREDAAFGVLEPEDRAVALGSRAWMNASGR
jgi:hypothetical protein